MEKSFVILATIYYTTYVALLAEHIILGNSIVLLIPDVYLAGYCALTLYTRANV